MHVLEIWRYPIKSVGGEQLDSADVVETGIVGDRAFGLVDDTTGLVLTARREPRLLFANARLVDGRPVTVTDDGQELVESADYAAWLDRPVTLAAASADGGTYENPDDAEGETDWQSWQGPGGAWHDSARSRVSLVSTRTMGDWDFRRFRSNVLLAGGAEDDLVGRTVRLGSTALDVLKPITRCVMVTRPQPGLERDLDVLRTINRDRAATLAIGAVVNQTGTFAPGDTLEPR